MAKRSIIKIDNEKCNGCGLCIPNCPEGALQVIDGKVRLVSDLFCDGLGSCIGHCPTGAITIEEREAEDYDEKKVMQNIIEQGENVIIAHLKHLKEHGEEKYLQQAMQVLRQSKVDIPVAEIMNNLRKQGGCPGAQVKELQAAHPAQSTDNAPTKSQIANWPVQIKLVPAFAPFLENAQLLISADCVPFAYAGFHNGLLRGKTLLVGCPKLDEINNYKEKFLQIFQHNKIKSVTYARMEVPCCYGMVTAIKEALEKSGKNIPFSEVVISIQGERL